MSAVASLTAGARSAGSRLQQRSSILVLVAALLSAVVIAVLERHAGVVGAADRALVGVFRLVVPLVAFAYLQTAIGPENLREAVWPIARYGHHRGFVALGYGVAGTAVAAGVSLLAGIVALLVARLGAADADSAMPLATDLAVTSFIAVAVSFGYGGWLALGATFGRAGGGRGIVLLADFLVGSLGFFAVVLPRGAAYSLIGREAALDLSARVSSILLAAVTLLCFALTFVRCRR